MTIKEIYYRIITGLESGRVPSSNSMWERQVYFDIHNTRALFLRRQLEKSWQPNAFTQSLNITLELTTEEIQSLSTYFAQIKQYLSNSAQIYKSTVDIPTLIRVSGKPEILSCSSQTFGNIQYVVPSYFKYVYSERYTSHKPKITLIGQTLYFILTSTDSIKEEAKIFQGLPLDTSISYAEMPQTVNITALFENPLHQQFGLDEDSEYPIRADIAEQIIEYLSKRYKEQKNEYEDQSFVQSKENLQSS